METEMLQIARRFHGVVPASVLALQHDPVLALVEHNEATVDAVVSALGLNDGEAALCASARETAQSIFENMQASGGAGVQKKALLLVPSTPMSRISDHEICGLSSVQELHARIGAADVEGLFCSCDACAAAGKREVPASVRNMAGVVQEAGQRGIAAAVHNKHHGADLRKEPGSHRQLPPEDVLRYNLARQLIPHWHATLIELCALLAAHGYAELGVIDVSGSPTDFGVFVTPGYGQRGARLVPVGGAGSLSVPPGFAVRFGVGVHPGYGKQGYASGIVSAMSSERVAIAQVSGP
jgi:hypothetical protein